MENRKSLILNIWFVFIIFYVCFRHFFEEDNFFYITMDMLFFLVVLKGFYQNMKIKGNAWWGFYAVLVLDMIFSIFYAIDFSGAVKFTVLYLNFLIIAFWFTQWEGWQTVFYKWLKIGCLFHLAYTFFSIVFTQQALAVSARFLPADAQSSTIRWAQQHSYAGISGQTGKNAFFFSVLIGLFLAEISSRCRHRCGAKILFVSSWVGLLATGKKGLLIAAALAALAVCWIMGSKVNKKAVLVLLNMGAFMMIFLCTAFYQQVYQIFENSVFSRLKLIGGMLSAIEEKPVLGNGVNSIIAFTHDGHLGHNIYLQMWVEQGIVGLILLLSAFAAVFYLTYRKTKKEACGCGIQTGCYLSLYIQVFVLIYGCFENPIYDYNFLITYLLIIAAGFADVKPENERIQDKRCSFEI